MPFTPVLLILIAVILLADIAIVATASARRDHGRRPTAVGVLARPGQVRDGSVLARLRAGRSDRHGPGSGSREGRTPIARGEDAQTAAAIEAFVSDVDARPGGGVRRPIPAVAGPSSVEIDDEVTTNDPPGSLQPAERRADHARSATWEALLADESARVRRFGRPATVVLAEYPGLDAVAEHLGAAAADRIPAEIDRVLSAESRATDRVVRLGPARFGVLLVETDAADARLYVERVRDAVGAWFASAGLSPRLAIGWASPDDGEDLAAAAATALLRARTPDAVSAAPLPR